MTKLIINIQSFDPQTQSEILNQLDFLKNKFPLIYENLEYVGVKEGLGENYATTAKTNKYIYLNSTYFSKRDEFLKDLKKKSEEQFFLENCYSIESVISHEFGHIIQNTYLLQDNIYLIPILKKGEKKFFHSNPDIGTIADIMGKWIAIGFMPIISAKYINNQTNSVKKKREAFAESFSSIIHTPKSKWEPCVILIESLIRFIEESPRYLLTEESNKTNNDEILKKYESIKKQLIEEFGIDLEKDYTFRLG